MQLTPYIQTMITSFSHKGLEAFFLTGTKAGIQPHHATKLRLQLTLLDTEHAMAKMHSPAHPGEILREWLPETLTVTAAAQQLGISRVMLSKILNGKAGITAEMALRLAAWLDTTPEAWLGMQTSWDLAQAIKKAPAKVSPLRLHA